MGIRRSECGAPKLPRLLEVLVFDIFEKLHVQALEELFCVAGRRHTVSSTRAQRPGADRARRSMRMGEGRG